jgi:hypothetical protein
LLVQVILLQVESYHCRQYRCQQYAVSPIFVGFLAVRPSLATVAGLLLGIRVLPQ